MNKMMANRYSLGLMHEVLKSPVCVAIAYERQTMSEQYRPSKNDEKILSVIVRERDDV